MTLAAVMAASALSAGATVVKAHMDSTALTMGKMGVIQLLLEKPAGDKGRFPLFDNVVKQGYVGVLNDSVEFRNPQDPDTIESGRNVRIIFKVPVQAFDSGTYVLPPFEYVSGKDTVRSNSLTLQVVPVAVNADDAIDDYAGTADPEDPGFFDWVPDWVLQWWWLLILILLFVGAFIYAMRRYKKEGSILPRKPEPTPYERAMSSLVALKEKKLWEQGMEKEYFTELTEILRLYLYGRFHINAMEMTSRQILNSLSKNTETKEKRAYFRKILDMADFVKFAKVRPLPDDNIASYDNAVRFVEETKPVEKSEEDEAEEKVAPVKKSKKVKKGKKRGGEK